MYFWVIDLDEKGKVLMFGGAKNWNYERAEAFMDKNCSKLALVAGPTKSRDRTRAKEEDEVKDAIREILAKRKTIVLNQRRLSRIL